MAASKAHHCANTNVTANALGFVDRDDKYIDMLVRKDKTYRLTNLPKLKADYFTYNGRRGFTGSLIKRPVKGTIGLYKHTGLIYGYDHNNILWIIENNLNGVECITLRDFAQGMNFIIELNTNPLMIGTIMHRAHEKSTTLYNARKNNCEAFTNYCLTGIHHSFQSERTEVLVDTLLSVSEIYLVTSSPTVTILETFTKLRKSLQIDRNESVDNLINDIIKKRIALKPPAKATDKPKTKRTKRESAKVEVQKRKSPKQKIGSGGKNVNVPEKSKS